MNLLDMLGNGVNALGEGLNGLGQGITNAANSINPEWRAAQSIGQVMANSQNPDLTPDQQIQVNRLYQLGTPEAIKVASSIASPEAIAARKLQYAQAANQQGQANTAPAQQANLYAEAQKNRMEAGRIGMMQNAFQIASDPNSTPQQKQMAGALFAPEAFGKSLIEGGTPLEQKQKETDMKVGETLKSTGAASQATLDTIGKINNLLGQAQDIIGPVAASEGGQTLARLTGAGKKAQAIREQIKALNANLKADVIKQKAVGGTRMDIPLVNNYMEIAPKIDAIDLNTFKGVLNNLAQPAQKAVNARTAYDLSGDPELSILAAESGVDLNHPTSKTFLNKNSVNALIKSGKTPQDIIGALPKSGSQENIPTGQKVNVGPKPAEQRTIGETHTNANGKTFKWGGKGWLPQ